MSDTVHTATEAWQAIYRCDLCHEIAPQRGPYKDIKLSKVLIYHSDCVVVCYDCLNSQRDEYRELLFASSAELYLISISTYDALNKAILRHGLSTEQKVALMQAAHFVGERPEV